MQLIFQLRKSWMGVYLMRLINHKLAIAELKDYACFDIKPRKRFTLSSVHSHQLKSWLMSHVFLLFVTPETNPVSQAFSVSIESINLLFLIYCSNVGSCKIHEDK